MPQFPLFNGRSGTESSVGDTVRRDRPHVLEHYPRQVDRLSFDTRGSETVLEA